MEGVVAEWRYHRLDHEERWIIGILMLLIFKIIQIFLVLQVFILVLQVFLMIWNFRYQ